MRNAMRNITQNPFYVHPGGDWSQGMQGLATSLDRFGEIKRADDEKERLKKVDEGAAEVFQSGDFNAIAEYSLKNPEVAQNLLKTSELRDTKTKNFYVDTLFEILQDPENIDNITSTRRSMSKAMGITPKNFKENSVLKEKYAKDPEGTLEEIEKEIAFLSPARYKLYKEGLTEGTNIKDNRTADIQNIEYYKNLQETNPDLADKFATGAGFIKEEKDRSTAAMKNFDKFIDLQNTNPEQAKLFGDQIGIDRVTPYSDVAKLKTDFDNGLITEEDYENKRDKILNPTMKTTAELTEAALRGDPEAKAILEKMWDDAVTLGGRKSEAATKGKLKGLYEAMDLDSRAQAVLEGRETIDNIRNTFGVPIQEVVAAKVLEVEPDFNFVQPRAIQKSLSSSLAQQQKNRGAMGSFVQNIGGQLDKVDDIMNKVIKRWGARAADVPWRNIKTLAIGAGDERVLEAYMKEISVEIFKLSQGSTASVALLPEKGREEWEKIHDVNLSYPELKKVLEGTRDMANIRLKSVNDEIKETVERLGNVRSLNNPYSGKPGGPGAEFPNSNTVTVTNPDTGEEEVWDTKTEKRIK